MNITFAEEQENPVITAKTCGCKERTSTQKVAYTFSDYFHNLCMDKKYIIQAEIEACERLLKYAKNISERVTVEKEIAELKVALDLMP